MVINVDTKGEKDVIKQNHIKRFNSTTKRPDPLRTTTRTTTKMSHKTTNKMITTKTQMTSTIITKTTNSLISTEEDSDRFLNFSQTSSEAVTGSQELSSFQTPNIHLMNKSLGINETKIGPKDIDEEKLIQLFAFIFSERCDFIKTLLNNDQTFDRNSYEDMIRNFDTTEDPSSIPTDSSSRLKTEEELKDNLSQALSPFEP